MIESRKLVVIGLLVGLALVAAGLALAPFGNAQAATGSAEFDAAQRIGVAFQSLPQIKADPALAAAASLRASKGDLGGVDCRAATWPNIDAACLTKLDGRPAGHVRTITIGYDAGSATTVLMRIPAAEMAQN